MNNNNTERQQYKNIARQKELRYKAIPIQASIRAVLYYFRTTVSPNLT